MAYWTRTAKVDVEMDGQHIAKGERVVSTLRSANRDEEVFESPFTFDIGRQPNPHVAFGGGGPHHCLGAMLARAELRAHGLPVARGEPAPQALGGVHPAPQTITILPTLPPSAKRS